MADHTQSKHGCLRIQPSWFSEVKWVSRHDQSNQISCENVGARSSSVPRDLLVNSATHLPKVAVPTSPTPLPITGYSVLVSELNALKEQLMPAAQLCADAINKTQRENATTPEHEFRKARSTCNPYESLGETFSKKRFNRRTKKSSKRNRYQQQTPGLSQFVNRSAIKLANIDALLGYCLTTAAQKLQNSLKSEDGSYVFVDLCGAPGGFSEYILYRHIHPASLTDHDQVFSRSSNSRDSSGRGIHGVQSCHGFGMSLSGSNDDGKGAHWDLDHLKHYHLNFNDPRNSYLNEKLSYHVCNGADNSGSIYTWDNVLSLQREISTTILGEAGIGHSPFANLVVADGGFDAQRDSNNQEGMAHRIIVSQTAAALFLLRPGGIFVLKMFGFREERTRQLLNFVYKCFDKMTFVKPILSRPASAERYLVCQGYTGPGIGWDGFTWREQMMVNSDGKKRSVQSYGTLEKLMDSFDLQMLQLNIDTCSSIIEYLRNKSAEQEGNDTPLYQKPNHYLDLDMYAAAWQLFSQSKSLGKMPNKK